MKILITGACGYVGSRLVPVLLADGHKVTGLDSQLFGNGFLPDNENLQLVKGDIRNRRTVEELLRGCNCVIHLAGLTNDGICQRHEDDALSTNVEAFEPLVRAARNFGVGRFIFLSSVAVYGNTTVPVKEDHPLNPTTLYGKHKAACEAVINNYANDQFQCFILRPAGICGYAPRMRFDLTLNMMTLHAVRNGVIKIQGGEQVRPHLHIKDLTELMLKLLHYPSGGIYNVSRTNLSVQQAAELVAGIIPAKIEIEPRSDDRSYHVASAKVREIQGINHPLIEGIEEVGRKLQSGYWPDALTNPVYMNIP